MSFFKDLKNKIIKQTKSNDIKISNFDDQYDAGFLQGDFLVSTTQIQEVCFKQSVIFIASHNETGAMGLIINKEQKNVPMLEVLKGLSIEGEVKQSLKLPLYFGGPVEGTRGFVIHSDDYKIKNTVSYNNGIAISSEKQAVEDYISGKGAKNMCLVLGYAGWVPGQLEQELQDGAWISVPANKELMFEVSNESKWKKAASSVGVDILKLNPYVGNA